MSTTVRLHVRDGTSRCPRRYVSTPRTVRLHVHDGTLRGRDGTPPCSGPHVSTVGVAGGGRRTRRSDLPDETGTIGRRTSRWGRRDVRACTRDLRTTGRAHRSVVDVELVTPERSVACGSLVNLEPEVVVAVPRDRGEGPVVIVVPERPQTAGSLVNLDDVLPRDGDGWRGSVVVLRSARVPGEIAVPRDAAYMVPKRSKPCLPVVDLDSDVVRGCDCRRVAVVVLLRNSPAKSRRRLDCSVGEPERAEA
jgi:hypothetical protein